MNTNQLYGGMLDLKEPWSAKNVTLSQATNQLIIEIALKRGVVWADPTNASARANINGWTERQWRHLNTCQYQTIIKARGPQLKYSDGTAKELPVPWADRYACLSLAMESFVVELLQACPNNKSVCYVTDLSRKTEDMIMKKAVERGLTRRVQVPMEHLGLDEKSIA